MARTYTHFDRFMNPDGGRKRKKSQEHKPKTDYKRFSKSEIHKLIQEGKITIEEYLKNKHDDTI